MAVFETIKKLASFRDCRDETVDRSTMGKILEAGRQAPSPGNVQSLEFIVVEDDHKKELLENAVGDQRIGEAPTLVIVVGDFERMARKAGEKAREYCNSEAACGIQNMRLTASEEGVLSCWITGFDEDFVADQFSIPEGKAPLGIVLFGYSDHPIQKSDKFGLNSVCFYDEYDNQVDSFFDFPQWKGVGEEKKIYGKKSKGLVDKLWRFFREE